MAAMPAVTVTLSYQEVKVLSCLLASVVVTSKTTTKTGGTRSIWEMSRTKVDAAPAGPSQRLLFKRPCKPSRKTQNQFASLSKKVLTVTIDRMAVEVAGCTTTGKCPRRLDHRPRQTIHMKLRTEIAEIRIIRKLPLRCNHGAGSVILATMTISKE